MEIFEVKKGYYVTLWDNPAAGAVVRAAVGSTPISQNAKSFLLLDNIEIGGDLLSISIGAGDIGWVAKVKQGKANWVYCYNKMKVNILNI